MSDKITILYVDDEHLNLVLFRINFQKKYSVILSYSGIEGLEHLRTHPEIVIVISDMKMPGMDGLEFIKKAKSEFPNVVFFILTGYDITPEIENALETDLICKYFSKPFKLAEIEDAFSQVIMG